MSNFGLTLSGTGKSSDKQIPKSRLTLSGAEGCLEANPVSEPLHAALFSASLLASALSPPTSLHAIAQLTNAQSL